MDERPVKRARQACDQCRRKKTRCPGEKPVCSFCARLSQPCTFSDGIGTTVLSNTKKTRGTQHAEETTTTLENRFELLEAKVDRMFSDVLLSPSAQKANSLKQALQYQIKEKPPLLHQYPETETKKREPDKVGTSIDSVSHVISPLSVEVTLPSTGIYHTAQNSLPYAVRIEVVKCYTRYCDAQPFILFDTDHLVNHFSSYPLSIQYLVLAAGLRFYRDLFIQDEQPLLAIDYLEKARRIIFGDISVGDVQTTTLQSLCMCVLLDLSALGGNFNRARIHTSIGANLALSKVLASKSATLSQTEIEEIRRCYWSFYYLSCLTGGEPIPVFLVPHNRPPFPVSLSVDLEYCSSIQPSTSGSPTSTADIQEDLGIVGYSLQLLEMWQTSLQYVVQLSIQDEVPWAPNSTQFQIVQRIMELESYFCRNHKNAHVRFAEHRADGVEDHSRYWRPWLFIQFTYHATLCLLHHPFVYSDKVRVAESSEATVFLEKSSDLALLHAKHIARLVDALEQKGVEASDPFLGYCAGVAATTLLWSCYDEDGSAQRRARALLSKCYKFILALAKPWPVARRMANNLALINMRAASWEAQTGETCSTYRIPEPDVQLMWKLLKYSTETDPSLDEFQAGLLAPEITANSSTTHQPGMIQADRNPGEAGHLREASYLLYEQSVSASTFPFTSGEAEKDVGTIIYPDAIGFGCGLDEWLDMGDF
ncbi:hypothetical protein BX600DRAFT_442459 [Xylariales sp. PMI_506]|nr:hypothetical protein BX600DRAFT_442459 [Xylariales sp. PMI_506]